MPNGQERRSVDDDRADRQVIRDVAAALRRNAIRAGYEGLPGKHYAFALALVLDELARPPTRPAAGGARGGVAGCPADDR